MRFITLLLTLVLGSSLFGAEETVGEAAQTVPDTPLGLRTGVVEKVPMTTRFYKNMGAASSGRLQQSMFTTQWWMNGKTGAHEKADKEYVDKIIGRAMFSPLEAESVYIYVPKGYNGKNPYGIYLHLAKSPPVQRASPAWQELMDKHKLIYVSPYGVSDGIPWYKATALALDAIATVRKNFKTNPKRIYAGGTSDGGKIVYMLPCAAPKLFKGVIAVSKVVVSAGMPRAFGNAESKMVKYAIISSVDDWYYSECKAAVSDLGALNINVKMVEIQGEFSDPSPEQLDECLTWMESGGKSSAPKRDSASKGKKSSPNKSKKKR